jgi:hypothetical protein
MLGASTTHSDLDAPSAATYTSPLPPAACRPLLLAVQARCAVTQWLSDVGAVVPEALKLQLA